MKRIIGLGDKARDIVTGFTGIVVATTEWLNGCCRYTLQPQELKDGKPVESFTFDIEQIELVESKVIRAMEPSGGPMPEPTRTAAPKR